MGMALSKYDEIAASAIEGVNGNDNSQGQWIQTYTGRQFWPMDPRSDEIFIEDIAHALSMQCRYAGHCLKFYSVAEHSVLVAQWVFEKTGDDGLALWALLHDAAEAYLVDVPRPVKPYLRGYDVAEARVMKAVCARFGLHVEMPEIVHEADDRILCDERAQNMMKSPHEWNIPDDPLGIKLQCWHPQRAEVEFISAFNFYGGRYAC